MHDVWFMYMTDGQKPDGIVRENVGQGRVLFQISQDYGEITYAYYVKVHIHWPNTNDY